MSVRTIVIATLLVLSFSVGMTTQAYTQYLPEKSQEEEVAKIISLEDRFANLMEALSDNGTMKYDVTIEAHLLNDDIPELTIILYLKDGEYIY